MLNISTSGFDKPLFPDLTRYIQTLPDTLADEALDLGVQFESVLSEIYNEAPPRDDSVFVWSSDKAANKRASSWWWANLKEGNIPTDGSHYLRQGKPPYGAKVLVEKTPDGVVIIFTQTWGKSHFIFGQLNGVDNRLIGHKRTGWEYAQPKFKQAQKIFLKELDSRILARLRSGK